MRGKRDWACEMIQYIYRAPPALREPPAILHEHPLRPMLISSALDLQATELTVIPENLPTSNAANLLNAVGLKSSCTITRQSNPPEPAAHTHIPSPLATAHNRQLVSRKPTSETQRTPHTGPESRPESSRPRTSRAIFVRRSGSGSGWVLRRETCRRACRRRRRCSPCLSRSCRRRRDRWRNLGCGVREARVKRLGSEARGRERRVREMVRGRGK